MFFSKICLYDQKHTLFFPILHVFAPLNDVRTYSAWSWKTTLITWIFGRAWYPPWHSSGPPGMCSPYIYVHNSCHSRSRKVNISLTLAYLLFALCFFFLFFLFCFILFCFGFFFVQKWFKTVQQHSRFWTEYFGEILRSQRMVAELRLTDQLPELADCGVLESELDISRSESYFSRPRPYWGWGWSFFPMKKLENSLSYFARYQFIPVA